jgi:hypothetical protein
MSDDKLGLLDNLRDMENNYRIVKEDLRTLEGKYREATF